MGHRKHHSCIVDRVFVGMCLPSHCLAMGLCVTLYTVLLLLKRVAVLMQSHVLNVQETACGIERNSLFRCIFRCFPPRILLHCTVKVSLYSTDILLEEEQVLEMFLINKFLLSSNLFYKMLLSHYTKQQFCLCSVQM
jgi:hypothetical protein